MSNIRILDLLQKSEKRPFPARRAGKGNTFTTPLLLVRACPVLIWAFSWSGAVQAALAPSPSLPRKIFCVTSGEGILKEVTGKLAVKLNDFFLTQNESTRFSLDDQEYKLDLLSNSGCVALASVYYPNAAIARWEHFFSTACPVAQGYLEKRIGQSLQEEYVNITPIPGFVAALADRKEGAVFPSRSVPAAQTSKAPPPLNTTEVLEILKNSGITFPPDCWGGGREAPASLSEIIEKILQRPEAELLTTRLSSENKRRKTEKKNKIIFPGKSWEGKMGTPLKALGKKYMALKSMALDSREHYQSSDTWYIRGLRMHDSANYPNEVAFCWPNLCGGAILLDMYQAHTGIFMRQYFVVLGDTSEKERINQRWHPRVGRMWLKYSPLFPPEEMEALSTEEDDYPLAEPPAQPAADSPGEWCFLPWFFHMNQMLLQAFFDADGSKECEEKQESSPPRGRADHERIDIRLHLDAYFDEEEESATCGESIIINKCLAQAAARYGEVSGQIFLSLSGAPICPQPWASCSDQQKQEAAEKLARLQLALLYGWKRYEGDLGKTQLQVVTSPAHATRIRQTMASAQWWEAFLKKWWPPYEWLKDSKAVDLYDQLHKELSCQETDLATNLNSLFDLLSQAYRLEKHEQSVQEEKSIQEEVDRLEKHEQRKLASSGKKRKKQSVQEEKSIQEEVDRLWKERKELWDDVYATLWEEKSSALVSAPQAVRLRERLKEEKPPLCATELRQLLEAAWEEGLRAWDRKCNEASPSDNSLKIGLYGYFGCKVARECAVRIGNHLVDEKIPFLWRATSTHAEAQRQTEQLKQLCACNKDLACLQKGYRRLLIEGYFLAGEGASSSHYKARLDTHIEHLKKIHFSSTGDDMPRVNTSLVQHLNALSANINMLTPYESSSTHGGKQTEAL